MTDAPKHSDSKAHRLDRVALGLTGMAMGIHKAMREGQPVDLSRIRRELLAASSRVYEVVLEMEPVVVEETDD